MPRSVTGQRSRRRPAPTVTRAFLFSDLRDYTDFVEAHGDAAAADLLRAYREIVRAEVERHSGAEIKTEGDSFYVVFEAPSAALECAVAIQRAAHERSVIAGATTLRIGIGLHAGETVPYDDQFVGSAVNIAARLASKAKAGEIIASDTLRGLVRTAVRYDMEDRGPLRLKGLSERVRAWSVEWRKAVEAPAHSAPAVSMPLLTGTVSAPATAVPGQILCPVVVGRDAERARFAEILRRSAAGRGEAVILSGEAGVGKSAFVRSAIAGATEAGFRVLYGATLEADKGLPYAPFVAAVRSGFRGIARDRLGKVLAQAAPDLAQLFPELGRAQRAEGSAVEQHRLSVAFLGLFTTFATEVPVLLVVEDLHWADEASLGLFHYLARELRDARVALLGTYRSDEMHRRHPFLRALAAMQRERVVTEIALGRLDREQVRALILETFKPRDPNVRVTDEFLEAIYGRSDGNPFFTEELLKSLVESGDLYWRPESGWARDKPIDQLRIPGSVKEAVRERIDRLSEEAQASLSAAAVIGLRAPFGLLGRVRGVSESVLEDHLREQMEQQLIVEVGGDDDEYAFRHALTKEVVYDDLLVRERKRLHRAVADALAADPRAEPALLAHHLVAAGAGEAAIPHLLTAAERAFRAYAPREAAAHYEKAIEIGLPDDELASVLERLADVYYLYDFAHARKAAEDAASLHRARKDPLGTSRMLRLASRSVWQQGDATRAGVIGQEAVDVLDGLDESRELGRAIANLATLRMLARADAEAIALAERAVAIGRRFDDAWTVANGLITRGTTLSRSDWDTGSRLNREGIEIARRADLAEVVLRGINNLLVNSAGHLSSEERDVLIDDGQVYAHAHGLEHPMLLYNRVFRDWLRGDWDRALATSERIPAGSYWHRNTSMFQAQIALGREGPERGIAANLEPARAAAEQREAQSFTIPVAFMAALYVLAGEHEEARAWFGRLTARADEDGGVTQVLAGGPTALASILATTFERPDWLDKLDAAVPEDPVQAEVSTLGTGIGRAVLARDPARAAQLISALQELQFERGGGAVPIVPIAAVAELRRRGVHLDPSWRALLARSRAYSEKARATWFLSEIARVEASIAG